MDLMLTIRFLDDLAALGVTIPEDALNARAIFEEAQRAAAQHPSDDLKAALDAGEITAANVAERVHQAATNLNARQASHEIVRNLHTSLNRKIRDALRADVPRLHTELAAAFKPAAAAISKAAAHYGPETTADEVLSMGAEVVSLWNQTSTHVATLDAISQTYRSLLNDVLSALPEHPASLFVTEANDLDALRQTYRVRGSWLALARAGYKLRLNTPDQAADVVRKAREAEAALAAAARELELSAHRKRYMPLGMRG